MITKYNVGQQVWLIWDNIVKTDHIEKIEISKNFSQQLQILYRLPTVSSILIPESKLFKTKEELIQAISK